MTIDISTQQIAIILILGSIALIGSKYGDRSKKYASWLFIGGISTILLICYCTYLILNWTLNMI